jgi:hypothetical protein
MPWAMIYALTFQELVIPAGWQAATGGVGGSAVDNGRCFVLPQGGGLVWVAFSGAGLSRSVKLERYAAQFTALGDAGARHAKALHLRDALLGAGIAFQSGHNHRTPANVCQHGAGQCLWRTTQYGALAHAPHPGPRGVAVHQGEVGVEHAGAAGRIVAWRPGLLSRPNKTAPPAVEHIVAAVNWLNGAMEALAGALPLP